MTINEWLDNAAKFLIQNWGIDKEFASKVALLFAYFSQYGLSPVITSGFRDPEYQEELRRRYNAGDPSVVVPPAKNSKHSVTKWGKPSALAIDISTNNHGLAANIAEAIGIKAGLRFNTPDPVHFYV